jgi:hypothetical protein
MKESLKFPVRSFILGFFVCLGAWAASLLVVSGLTASRDWLAGTALMQTMQNLVPWWAPGGPGLFSPGTPAPAYTGGPLTLDIWMTLGKDPQAAHISSLSVGADQLRQAHIWVMGPPGPAVPFQLLQITPGGQVCACDRPFLTHPDGSATDCGGFASQDVPRGRYVTEVRIGETVAGRLIFSVTD